MPKELSNRITAPREDARFSVPYENRRWPGRHLPPTRHGAQEADRQLREVARIPGFPKSVRLLRSSDFRRVYDQGTRYTCPFFAAFSYPNPGASRRFYHAQGLGKAVVRNRIKRRMREAVRLELPLLSPEWSIVFNPRRKALDCFSANFRRKSGVSLSGVQRHRPQLHPSRVQTSDLSLAAVGCRFYPTCSEYMRGAVEAHGVARGSGWV